MAAKYRPANQVVAKAPIDWSYVTPTIANLEKLELLTSTAKVLAREGYVFAPLTEATIWKKNRCQNCGVRLKKFTPRPVFGQSTNLAWTDNVEQALDQLEYDHIERQFHTGPDQRHFCFFHDGKLFKGRWGCCDGSTNSRGCCSLAQHLPGNLDQLNADWLYVNTPIPNGLEIAFMESQQPPGSSASTTGGHKRNKKSYNRVPPPQSYGNLKDPRHVVALDCEMGTSLMGESVLIKVSLIDFFTRQALIDKLVQPSVEMAHYNTRYSGVTFSMMNQAIRSRNVIKGTDAARELVFKYVNANTIIIMHGGSSDLNALRIIHPPHRILDTFIVEGYDRLVKEKGLKRSLKDVCERRCGIHVQNAKLTNGRNAGHDSLEDALGAREIVCAWLAVIPDE